MEKEKVKELPSKETVADWIKHDLHSAHYLLGVILYRHPEILQALTDELYARALEGDPLVESNMKTKKNG